MGKILLNKAKSKRSTNKTCKITARLARRAKLLPSNDVRLTLDELELYEAERTACTKLRICLNINTICSNVLFNRITEVVYKEGSDDAILVNVNNNIKDLDSFYKKNNLGSVFLTRNTSLANNSDYTYHCGIDIFNNHMLRNNTFKTVCQTKYPTDVYNTIADLMRDYRGNQVTAINDDKDSKSSFNFHLYLKEEIDDYDVSCDKNLIEKNGWVGFINKANIKTYDKDDKEIPYLPIGTKPPCGMVDMAPERELFCFSPIYNQYRNRIEKNWEYYLTYPYSSTTEMSFIREDTNSLKALCFDDDAIKVSSRKGLKIYSICKHGLVKDDIVNIYNGDDIILAAASVLEVVDDYTFIVFNNQGNISEEWITLEDGLIPTITSNTSTSDTRRTFIKNQSGLAYEEIITSDTSNTIYTYYPINSQGTIKMNIDSNTLDISYKQIVDGDEVDYYVRLFKKIPNNKFKELTDLKYHFDNNVSKLAWSTNVYGDSICQVLYTDDIDIDGLTDNLGRPLTEIFFTVLKNNKGYKEWYGYPTTQQNKEKTDSRFGSDEIEYSHMFGKLNCAFQLSDASMRSNEHKTITRLTNIIKGEYTSGLDVSSINETKDRDEKDEILIKSDDIFYGDICCYSKTALAEKTIDDVYFRFNTAQREVTDEYSLHKYFKTIYYDEILSDDYDMNGFNWTDKKPNKIENANLALEGYCYKPHFKISIHTFSNTLEQDEPYITKINSVLDLGDNKYQIMTNESNYLEKDEEFVIYNHSEDDNIKDEYYTFKVTKLLSNVCFECECDNMEEPHFSDEKSIYKVLKKQINIPSEAILKKDGSCKYIWRNIIPNGYDNLRPTEMYPFTNGALYIEKNLNLFVRRQDPNQSAIFFTPFYDEVRDWEPNVLDPMNEDAYYNEDEISC